jgi:hypothetical protein
LHCRSQLAACQKGLSVGFVTAAALVHELMEARDERKRRLRPIEFSVAFSGFGSWT